MNSFQLTEAEQVYLLSVARASIAEHAGASVPSLAKKPDSETLDSRCGAFVTLWKQGELRGCIGYIIGFDPLTDTIHEAARAAAFEDPRFPPVQADELSSVRIEISVLSEPAPMTSYDEYQLGVHGLIVRDGRHAGLLLPQVATEHGMTREEFFTALCRKAGLPGNEWQKRQLTLSAFTAFVFGEESYENS